MNFWYLLSLFFLGVVAENQIYDNNINTISSLSSQYEDKKYNNQVGFDNAPRKYFTKEIPSQAPVKSTIDNNILNIANDRTDAENTTSTKTVVKSEKNKNTDKITLINILKGTNDKNTEKSSINYDFKNAESKQNKNHLVSPNKPKDNTKKIDTEIILDKGVNNKKSEKHVGSKKSQDCVDNKDTRNNTGICNLKNFEDIETNELNTGKHVSDKVEDSDEYLSILRHGNIDAVDVGNTLTPDLRTAPKLSWVTDLKDKEPPIPDAKVYGTPRMQNSQYHQQSSVISPQNSKTLSLSSQSYQTPSAPQYHQIPSGSPQSYQIPSTPQYHQTPSVGPQSYQIPSTPKYHQTPSVGPQSYQIPSTPQYHQTPSISPQSYQTPSTPQYHQSPSATSQSYLTPSAPQYYQSPPISPQSYQIPSSLQYNQSPSISPQSYQTPSPPQYHQFPSISPQPNHTPSTSQYYQLPYFSQQSYQTPSSEYYQPPSFSQQSYQTPSFSQYYQSPSVSPQTYQTPSVSPQSYQNPFTSQYYQFPYLTPQSYQTPPIMSPQNDQPSSDNSQILNSSPSQYPLRDNHQAHYPSSIVIAQSQPSTPIFVPVPYPQFFNPYYYPNPDYYNPYWSPYSTW